MTKKSNGSRKPSRDTLLEFPCRFPIKAMGRASEGFQAIVTHIVRGHAELWPGESVRCNESRNGNYLAVTVRVMAESREQMDRIYQDLVDHEHVTMAL